jgi:magnesium-transporting ATPase (P-type)
MFNGNDNLDVIAALQTGASSIPPILNLLSLVFGMIGLVIIGSCLVTRAQSGRAMQPPPKGNLTGIFVGAFFFSMQQLMIWISNSWLGTYVGGDIVQPFNPLSGADKFAQISQVVVAYLMLLGWIQAGRGLFSFYEGPRWNKEGYVKKGLGLLIMGSACINFYIFVDMLLATFGGPALGTEYFKFN